MVLINDWIMCIQFISLITGSVGVIIQGIGRIITSACKVIRYGGVLQVLLNLRWGSVPINIL